MATKDYVQKKNSGLSAATILNDKWDSNEKKVAETLCFEGNNNSRLQAHVNN